MKTINNEKNVLAKYKLGEYLKERRINVLKKTQTQIAKSGGLKNNSYISMVERGKIDKPSPDAVMKIAKMYDVDIKTLMNVYFSEDEKKEDLFYLFIVLKQIESDENIKYKKYNLKKEAAALLNKKAQIDEDSLVLIVKLYGALYKKDLLPKSFKSR